MAYVVSLREWVLNTREIYHLCPVREWFTNFHNLESGTVMMGNDQSYCTKEIGIFGSSYLMKLSKNS